ncbi:hypothetical protein Tco_0573012 [Tanacetum coccineum]
MDLPTSVQHQGGLTLQIHDVIKKEGKKYFLTQDMISQFRIVHGLSSPLWSEKTMTEANRILQHNREGDVAVVYAFEKFSDPFLIMKKSVVYSDHAPLWKYFSTRKSQSKIAIAGFLLLQELIVKDAFEFVKTYDLVKKQWQKSAQRVSAQMQSKCESAPYHDARVGVKFLKSLFSRFGISLPSSNDELVVKVGSHESRSQRILAEDGRRKPSCLMVVYGKALSLTSWSCTNSILGSSRCQFFDLKTPSRAIIESFSSMKLSELRDQAFEKL